MGTVVSPVRRPDSAWPLGDVGDEGGRGVTICHWVVRMPRPGPGKRPVADVPAVVVEDQGLLPERNWKVYRSNS